MAENQQGLIDRVHKCNLLPSYNISTNMRFPERANVLSLYFIDAGKSVSTFH